MGDIIAHYKELEENINDGYNWCVSKLAIIFEEYGSFHEIFEEFLKIKQRSSAKYRVVRDKTRADMNEEIKAFEMQMTNLQKMEESISKKIRLIRGSISCILNLFPLTLQERLILNNIKGPIKFLGETMAHGKEHLKKIKDLLRESEIEKLVEFIIREPTEIRDFLKSLSTTLCRINNLVETNSNYCK